MLEVDRHSWRALVQAEPKLCILFGFMSCEPCQRLKAALDRDHSMFADWPLVICTVPPSTGRELVAEGIIEHFPTLVWFRDGEVVTRLAGAARGDVDEASTVAAFIRDQTSRGVLGS